MRDWTHPTVKSQALGQVRTSYCEGAYSFGNANWFPSTWRERGWLGQKTDLQLPVSIRVQRDVESTNWATSLATDPRKGWSLRQFLPSLTDFSWIRYGRKRYQPI
jgi:hypothetical protein